MILLATAAGFVAGLVILGWLVPYLQRRAMLRPLAFGCARCSRPIRGRQLHRVTETWDDPEMPGAGTGVSATFCRAHCPGGCARGCRDRAKLAAA